MIGATGQTSVQLNKRDKVVILDKDEAVKVNVRKEASTEEGSANSKTEGDKAIVLKTIYTFGANDTFQFDKKLKEQPLFETELSDTSYAIVQIGAAGGRADQIDALGAVSGDTSAWAQVDNDLHIFIDDGGASNDIGIGLVDCFDIV
ncbi:MAG: hypothetical protein HRU31_17240 [Rhodobacteraceae bacterium]|nr:hypothetical protein [Paracoccaceae bacterium]